MSLRRRRSIPELMLSVTESCAEGQIGWTEFS